MDRKQSPTYDFHCYGCGEKYQEEIEKQEQRRAERQAEQIKKENEE